MRSSARMSPSISRDRIADLMANEEHRFATAHPKSAELFARAQRSLLGGVPMNWMTKWPGPFPPFVAEASGGHFACVDGHDYVDFCLGDTGAMTGHAPPATVTAMTATPNVDIKRDAGMIPPLPPLPCLLVGGL